MNTNTLTVYLAGSIRDGNAEDIGWRERMISACGGKPIVFISPLGGKTYNPETKMWMSSGVVPHARFITKHDKWSVEHCDAAVFNFSSLSQGYPTIGSLVEFGMAVEAGKLIYVIIAADYRGHGNEALFHLHPFIQEFAAEVFHTEQDASRFLRHHADVLTGFDPHFLGEVHD